VGTESSPGTVHRIKAIRYSLDGLHTSAQIIAGHWLRVWELVPDPDNDEGHGYAATGVTYCHVTAALSLPSAAPPPSPPPLTPVETPPAVVDAYAAWPLAEEAASSSRPAVAPPGVRAALMPLTDIPEDMRLLVG
jgi:hypothetical protein